MDLVLRLETLQSAMDFVHINEDSSCSIDVISGRYLINGKSLMSVFGIDAIRKDITVRLTGDDVTCNALKESYKRAGFTIVEE